MHTKKAGTTGRFGNKYGSKVRHAVAKIEARSRALHVCPQCLRTTLDRMSAGIWKCKKCSATIAGGAYSPVTAASKIMKGEVEAFAEEAPAIPVAMESVPALKAEEKKVAIPAEKPAKKDTTKAKAAKKMKVKKEKVEEKAS